MDYVEIELHYEIKSHFDTFIKEYLMNNWKRFLDECEMLWDTEKKTPEALLEILNSIHLSVKFIIEVSSENCSVIRHFDKERYGYFFKTY